MWLLGVSSVLVVVTVGVLVSVVLSRLKLEVSVAVVRDG